MYCDKQTRATVSYKFKNTELRAYTTEQVPIEVKLEEVYKPGFQGGQCLCAIYDVTIATTYSNNPGVGSPQVRRTIRRLFGPIGGMRIAPDSVIFNIQHYQALISCRGEVGEPQGCARTQTERQTDPNMQVIYSTVIESIIPFNNSPNNCGDPKNYCQLQVTHKGKTIHIDQGECPCQFSVSCGDCPEGTMRCNSTGYPGFCCIPCTEVAGEIKALASIVRRINNV